MRPRMSAALIAAVCCTVLLAACAPTKAPAPRKMVRLVVCPPDAVKAVCPTGKLPMGTVGDWRKSWQSMEQCRKEAAAWRATWTFCRGKALEK